MLTIIFSLYSTEWDKFWVECSKEKIYKRSGKQQSFLRQKRTEEEKDGRGTNDFLTLFFIASIHAHNLREMSVNVESHTTEVNENRWGTLIGFFCYGERFVPVSFSLLKILRIITPGFLTFCFFNLPSQAVEPGLGSYPDFTVVWFPQHFFSQNVFDN